MAYNTDAARWRALTIRDANANGLFVYSVKSTNIYCRPTCPARLARRANIGFYKTPSEAEADGFRACKRCKPNSVLEDPQERAVEKACALIDEALKKDDAKTFRLQDLAKSVGLTPRYFHKIFKDKMGMTPKEYTNAKSAQQTSSSATPDLVASSTDSDRPDSEPFDFNAFSDLVDFDPDSSATLGYNLVTGASQATEMGFGNAIDVNVLHQIWAATCEPNAFDTGFLFEDGKHMSILDPVVMPDMSNWSEAPDVFTSELDATALLSSDYAQTIL